MQSVRRLCLLSAVQNADKSRKRLLLPFIPRASCVDAHMMLKPQGMTLVVPADRQEASCCHCLYCGPAAAAWSIVSRVEFTVAVFTHKV